MFSRKRHPANLPRIPAGRRVYAIGDIHGESRLLKIDDDASHRGDADTVLLFMGDFIDRGCGAVSLLRIFSQITDSRIVILKGNHEAALVDVYRGDEEALAFWLRCGGHATLSGLGVPSIDPTLEPARTLRSLRYALSERVINWLDSLPHSWSIGDYFFAHAGVRPGLSFKRQDQDDLLWIREPFLSSRRWHGKVVVHGHTIEPGLPVLGGNRIGIDTGAHEHGCLTALGLEEDMQWLLQVEDGRARRVHAPLG
jgi:serine/threonine protein phosphatase 1